MVVEFYLQLQAQVCGEIPGVRLKSFDSARILATPIMMAMCPSWPH